MGRKHKRLINKIADWDNLVIAHRLARRGKRDRQEVAAFEADLWCNLAELQMQIIWGAYNPGRYRSFEVHEPKRRLIMALPYRDRVAQHAICNVCGPIWDRAMIDDTYACRPGKGTHAGANRLQQWLQRMHRRPGRVWFLKMDISQYFPSISHDLAKRVIRRKISCRRTLALLDRIIDSTASADDPAGRGIPVGNLTSQWIANLVGNEIDQWAKRDLGVKRYIRYMDDMVVLGWSKQDMLQAHEAFRGKLASLGFTFSKTSVLPATRGINFLGYRIWHDHRLLRKDSVTRARRRFKRLSYLCHLGSIPIDKVTQHVSSWVAHARHADSYGVRLSTLKTLVLSRWKARAVPTEK